MELGGKEIQAHKESPKALYAVGKYSKNIFVAESLLSRFVAHPIFMQIRRKLQRRFERASSENKRT